MNGKTKWTGGEACDCCGGTADTMYDAEGVGLAAPQVGILKRVVVIEIGDLILEMVNPEIVAREGEQTGAEGCLSIPMQQGEVTRPMKVKVVYQEIKIV